MTDFRQVLNILQDGQMICNVTHPNEFNSLREGMEKDVENAFKPFEINLTFKYGLYYLSYANLNNKTDLTVTRDEFKKIRDDIEPVIAFLIIIMKTEVDGSPLSPGDIINYDYLLKIINSENSYQVDLENIMRIKAFSSQKTQLNNADMLNRVLDVIKDKGYICLKNKSKQIYSVTGKIRYFYEVSEFIKQHHGISTEDTIDEKEQEEMLV